MKAQSSASVLLVCLGNICRSPTAHGVLEHRLREAGLEVVVDSAGTAAYHVGNPPDRRASAAASKRGIRLDHLRARQVQLDDFGRFDLVLAMDRDNLEDLLALCPAEHREKVRLFLDFAGEQVSVREVPDPYYGGDDGFEQVLDLVEAATAGLIEQLRREGA
ncbi:low molecular weight protein-tyrosine-phosphatase [Marinobacterium nitratireducens]|uniref:low molecular weight protein-tyrosine-phosphatase n=1 Tax=Marinobacterium nitratireducens TaxID=518897 RepID=UPI00166C0098|nr:low molecular weight protein-tyrosine-phosphatase [Marinobacterium nitratireducens]